MIALDFSRVNYFGN